MSESTSEEDPIDWEEVLWNLKAFKSNVLTIRDVALNQPDFTQAQLKTLAEIACGFANSFTLAKAIELIEESKGVSGTWTDP